MTTKDGRLQYDGNVWRYVSNGAIPPHFVTRQYVRAGEISHATSKQMTALRKTDSKTPAYALSQRMVSV